MRVAKLKAVVATAAIGAAALIIGPLAAADVPGPTPMPAAAERTKELIGRLGAKEFSTRQRAEEELEKLGTAALPALREAAAAKSDLDLKRRIERLMERIDWNGWNGPSALGVRKRLELMLRVNPKLSDDQTVRASYLLCIARMPTEAESKNALVQLKQAKDRRRAVLDMARTLVQGREFNQDLAAANLMMLNFQEKLLATPRPEMLILANTPESTDLIKAAAGKCKKAVSSLARHQLYKVFFLVTLSRLPTDKETASLDRSFKQAKAPNIPAPDLLWALINCNEFIVKR